jgi:hypothetical protein
MIELNSYRTGIQGTSLALSRVEGVSHKFTPMPGVHLVAARDAKKNARAPEQRVRLKPKRKEIVYDSQPRRNDH